MYYRLYNPQCKNFKNRIAGCRTRNVFQNFYTMGCRRRIFWSFYYVQNGNFEKLWRCRKSSRRYRKNHSSRFRKCWTDHSASLVLFSWALKRCFGFWGKLGPCKLKMQNLTLFQFHLKIILFLINYGILIFF